ncbi:AbrB/MazE/SpoVT family DNA-binding domain-containing protein [bacterium]|nr:AbrB/MazE/SpoVT family DNA-binding domain-containing protein [bacterium]
MLAKLTSKNQLTIPKKIIGQLPNVKYFDVELEGNVVILKPLTLYDTNSVIIKEKMKHLGLKQNCVAEAISWSRSK